MWSATFLVTRERVLQRTLQQYKALYEATLDVRGVLVYGAGCCTSDH